MAEQLTQWEPDTHDAIVTYKVDEKGAVIPVEVILDGVTYDQDSKEIGDVFEKIRSENVRKNEAKEIIKEFYPDVETAPVKVSADGLVEFELPTFDAKIQAKIDARLSSAFGDTVSTKG